MQFLNLQLEVILLTIVFGFFTAQPKRGEQGGRIAVQAALWRVSRYKGASPTGHPSKWPSASRGSRVESRLGLCTESYIQSFDLETNFGRRRYAATMDCCNLVPLLLTLSQSYDSITSHPYP